MLRRQVKLTFSKGNKKMPGYQSSGTEALQALAKEAKDKKTEQATDELKKFEELKQKEQKERSAATRRMVEAFSDCG